MIGRLISLSLRVMLLVGSTGCIGLSGCVTMSHVSEAFLVEDESGGVILLTKDRIAFYDDNLTILETKRQKRRYTMFGIVRMDGELWFAGHDLRKWNFGIAHGMNFEIHLMPVGMTEPEHVHVCNRCEPPFVWDVDGSGRDVISAFQTTAERGIVRNVLDVATMSGFVVDRYDDVAGLLGPVTSVEDDRVASDNSENARYASNEWLRQRYARCVNFASPLGSRAYAFGSANRHDRRVWTTALDGGGKCVRVNVDHYLPQVFLKDVDGQTQHSWDLREHVDNGYATVLGWFNYPNTGCDTAAHSGPRSALVSNAKGQNSTCDLTIAVLVGGGYGCRDQKGSVRFCHDHTGIFELYSNGRSRMIDRSDQNASATIRLSDGRVLVVLGTDIVAYNPLD